MLHFLEFFFQTRLVNADSKCKEPDYIIPQYVIKLDKAILDDKNIFIGEFELENIDKNSSIILAGNQVKNLFYLSYSYVFVEFRDLNRDWVSLSHQTPGSF